MAFATSAWPEKRALADPNGYFFWDHNKKNYDIK